MHHPSLDIIPERMVHDQDQQRLHAPRDIQSDVTDIMQKIMMSGILDWNPNGSFAANNIADDSLNANKDIRAHSMVIDDGGNAKKTDCSMPKKPRRPRGRPAKKSTTQREFLHLNLSFIHIIVRIGKKLKKMASKDRISSQRGNDKSRYIVRATSNPVQNNHQVNTIVLLNTGDN